MKYKINIDLKRYEAAVLELSKGNQEHIERSISLIKQHHIYHHGLKIYSNKPEVLSIIKGCLGIIPTFSFLITLY